MFDEFDDGDLAVRDLPNFRNDTESEGFSVEESSSSGQSSSGNSSNSEGGSKKGKGKNGVPKRVGAFVSFFQETLKNSTTNKGKKSLTNIYEKTIGKLSAKFFSNHRWPTWEQIQEFVQEDDQDVFKMFYLEVYYRHIYAKLTPTFEEYVGSFENYQALFEFFCTDASLKIELPKQWLWDILDEFLWQFQTFSHWRCRLRQLSDQDVAGLKETQVYSPLIVLDMLQQLVVVSDVMKHIQYGTLSTQKSNGRRRLGMSIRTSSMHKNLGYYAIIAQCRVHTQLCDYRLALKTIEAIDLSDRKGWFSDNMASYITLFFYTGFCYMMMKRYTDAIKIFQQILWNFMRTKQHHTSSIQFENMTKKAEQMLSLLAICITLTPSSISDDMLRNSLYDQYGDRILAMAKGNLEIFGEIFAFGSPKFVNPVHLDYDAEGKTNLNMTQFFLQKKLFLKDIERQICMPDIEGLLKLYTTLSVSRLGEFMGLKDQDEQLDEQAIQQKTKNNLVTFKLHAHQFVRTDGVALSGERSYCHDLSFFVESDMINIKQRVTVREFSEYFLRSLNKYDRILKQLDTI